MRPSLFGVSWDDLEAGAVERFLAAAGDEGLTWEAKGGGERPRPDTVRKAACGFANAIGGYFIVGAERDEQGHWTLPGIDFRDEEPATWLSTSIAGDGGVRPVPIHDAKAFERRDGRKAAVLAVDPVAAKPCMTAGGVVYLRVSGATLPVTDQPSRRWSRRAKRFGTTPKARHSEPRSGSRESRARSHQRRCRSRSACAQLGDLPTATQSFFSRAFLDRFKQLVHRRLQADPRAAYGVAHAIHQDGVRMWPAATEWGSGWTGAAYWNGAVAAVFCDPSTEIYVEELLDRVKQGWTALATLAADYAQLARGDPGDARIVVVFNREHAGITSLRRGVPTEPARRRTTLVPASEDDIASVERELRRGFGEPALER